MKKELFKDSNGSEMKNTKTVDEIIEESKKRLATTKFWYKGEDVEELLNMQSSGASKEEIALFLEEKKFKRSNEVK